ncbi:MAG: hypothetical protein KBS40_03170 [Bacteroidales bacterium]|nr:hypothetical protein [Bacteroidales bacterium]
MAKIKPMALIESMSGGVCEHSDTYFRTNKRTGRVYTGKLCNPYKGPVDPDVAANRTMFGTACANAKAILNATESDTANYAKLQTYKASYDANPKFPGTLYNFIVKKEYAALKEAAE